MINFLISYNFIRKQDADNVDLIEAIIANENYGSIGMVKKNSFVDLGEVKDLAESNGHKSHRWRLKLKDKNPVLIRAEQNENQSLIFPCDGVYPEEKMITFKKFFGSRYLSRYKKNYREIKNQILSAMNSIVDKKNINHLKEELSNWPAVWDTNKELKLAINLEKLPEEIASIKDENLHDKNKKYYIKCPDVLFKKTKKLLT